MQPSAETVEIVASKLMEWYARHKRQFPWRVGMRDDWRVLVTAYLLRKTRAETVAKHYDMVLAALSSPGKVLELGVEGVEKVLKPLGLHRVRARQLYELAKALAEGRGGKLPGVGPYTEALVRCLSRGELVPAVDVNVQRVVARLFGVGDRRQLEELASQLVKAAGTCELNLAVMDLAALVCRARKPRCGECPLAAYCVYARISRS